MQENSASQVGLDPTTGLPRVQPGSAAAAAAMPIQPEIPGAPHQFVASREHYVFTIPGDGVPGSWSRPDGDRTFALTLLSVGEEEQGMRAMMQSGGSPDPSAVNRNWLLSTIFAIGGRYTGRNFDTISSWLDDIGPKGRKYLDRAFQHLHSISEKQGEDFLASMQRRG